MRLFYFGFGVCVAIFMMFIVFQQCCPPSLFCTLFCCVLFSPILLENRCGRAFRELKYWKAFAPVGRELLPRHSECQPQPGYQFFPTRLPSPTFPPLTTQGECLVHTGPPALTPRPSTLQSVVAIRSDSSHALVVIPLVKVIGNKHLSIKIPFEPVHSSGVSWATGPRTFCINMSQRIREGHGNCDRRGKWTFTEKPAEIEQKA